MASTEAHTFAPGWYVADAFAHTSAEALGEEVFTTAALAEAERVTLNIAEDCEVVEVRANGDVVSEDGAAVIGRVAVTA